MCLGRDGTVLAAATDVSAASGVQGRDADRCMVEDHRVCLHARMPRSEDIARQAMWPLSVTPAPPESLGARRVVTARYCLYLHAIPSVSLLECLQVGPQDVPDVQAEVHGLLREVGRCQVGWTFPAADMTLHAALLAAGLSPSTDPLIEPHLCAMALTEEPAWPVDGRVTVREATTLEDFLAVAQLVREVYAMDEPDYDGLLHTQRKKYEISQQGQPWMRTYLAYLDGQVVGESQGVDGPFGTNLAGGSVLPSARGQGVYRALVQERWRHAVDRGVPVLTVQAGRLSEPILDRLGFHSIERQAVLLDRF